MDGRESSEGRGSGSLREAGDGPVLSAGGGKVPLWVGVETDKGAEFDPEVPGGKEAPLPRVCDSAVWDTSGVTGLVDVEAR